MSLSQFGHDTALVSDSYAGDYAILAAMPAMSWLRCARFHLRLTTARLLFDASRWRVTVKMTPTRRRYYAADAID